MKVKETISSLGLNFKILTEGATCGAQKGLILEMFIKLYWKPEQQRQ